MIPLTGLEGLIWTGQDNAQGNNQTNTKQYNGKMPEPFTPEYAKFLGKHARPVCGNDHYFALAEALKVAGDRGFVLSAADLSFANKQVMEENPEFKHTRKITGFSYEVAGIQKDRKTGKKKPVLLVLHGVNAIYPATTHYKYFPNAATPAQFGPEYEMRKDEFAALYQGRSLNSGNAFYYYNLNEISQPADRIFGVELDFDKCTEQHYNYSYEDTYAKASRIARQFKPATIDLEIARAGSYTAFNELSNNLIKELALLSHSVGVSYDYLLDSATTWQKEHILRRMLGIMHQECMVRPITHQSRRNINTTFLEPTTFAVIPDGVIK